ncbi:hypothetical protein A8924_6345 [Saccharopolyspora erythraea NRRL 2338]|uniref:Uncharacterized protein n=2 Tax=Saccharopolyspora erythraea TaxID=1836 RepID=A4FMA6_SACEN|nr:hypothetical protein [Saccharopolyspora erythraea]EQD87818.1 hypothetical protein N599_02475 [Saccharopolyspora erythraea D]PFG98819.1 hypothetical protein A8924_6345 [Saccharopolyspora erythraea NRRL 2338]QRK88816.1 hypothetical protein JQX30_30060 [Saccharopolyspora erythraea]CAM05181.1 hypothetical protein SACE_6001 [Saccharopolyspora erythraea NRRL 2338]
MESGEWERHAAEVTASADEVETVSRELRESGCDLGHGVVRVVSALREFAEALNSAGRGSEQN